MSKNPINCNAGDKDFIRNTTTCSCENVEYLTSTIDDLVITSDEIINSADSISKKGLVNFH